MAEALGTGLVVSLLLSEFVGLSAGGLITPAYLALLLDQPWRLVGTLAAAVVAFGAYKGLSGHLILYGRRRFVAMVLLGVAANWVIQAAAPAAAVALAVPVGTIGHVLPGLIANDFERQGILATVAMLAAATVAAALAIRALGL
ncbi:MAG: poly-gamma-glutamate biosynthesis protein PgsC [Armatimonadetes bacterium]|nr:poly-gamma-glutamate biosynthesis protein PgsC [Armatimonadota bacterium]